MLDWPGKVSATLFLSGCSLRCPYCHNESLRMPTDTSIDLIPVCRIQGLPPGTYHVSVRAIATNGLKSDFSPAAAFKL